MDREVIEQKLESLRRCVQLIQEKCPDSADTQGHDFDLQDSLSRAIQLCVDIGAHIFAGKNVSPPVTMGKTFEVFSELAMISAEPSLRMKHADGFRNVAVHNYETINWQVRACNRHKAPR